MRRRPLLKGALMLMGAGAVARGIGTVYRILIVRWAGSEALGLFQMVMPLLRTASTVATLRLPVALTRLTADASARGDLEEVERGRRLTAVLITVLSVLAAWVTISLAPFMANKFLTDPRTERLILWLPLAFVPSALTGIFRGFAEGRHNMMSTSIGQVAEQLVRVPVSLWLVAHWMTRGVEHVAAALVIGHGIGEIVGLVAAMVLSGWWAFSRERGQRTRHASRSGHGASGGTASRGIASGRRRGWHGLHGLWRRPLFLVINEIRTLKELLGVAVPLSLATAINTTAQMINVGLVPRRLLVAGFTMATATELYGQLTGIVMPLLYMPMLVVFPVATVLTPAIADAVAVGQYRGARRRFLLGAGGALLVGIVTLAVCRAFPAAIPQLLYGMPEVAPLVAVVGLGAPFAFTGTIFASILHALGKTNFLLLNFIATTLIRLVLIYYWTADPDLGITGALWALLVDYGLSAVINGWACWRYLRE